MDTPETTGPAHSHTVLHPLEPLTPEEIVAATALVRAAMEGVGNPDGELRFETVELAEPPKAAVRAFRPGAAIRREAWVSAYRTGRTGVWKHRVSLDDGAVLSQQEIPDARPMIQLEEFLEIEDAVKRDPRFVAACRARGIEDMGLVCVDPWSAGSFGAPEEAGRHISYGFVWVRAGALDNQYAHPVEGLNPVVDIKTGEVIRIEDRGGVPIPWGASNYDRTFRERVRDDLRPIDVVQPEGVSFAMEGRRIRWHDWSILIGFTAREGLVLHDIRLADRPVLYRASIAEMAVPYGSPEPNHARKNVFDIGEYGLGKLTNSLALGCDCLGAIHYLDGWIADVSGQPMRMANAVCIHEEDTGILWKHYDFRTERTEVRRGRRLVISSIATVGNYEYGAYWYFHLDGTIDFEMKATGIINTAGCVPGTPQKYGTEVAPGVVGQVHQHVFCARLDLSVDGDRNAVVECDTHAESPGDGNPYGNAFFVAERALETECGRPRAPEAERFWKFESRERVNAMGRPTAYKLEPAGSIAPFVHPESPSGRRMGFAYNSLWVTPHHPDERFPSGEFVNGSEGGEGLPAWVAQGRGIADADIVAWHSFGIHHLPRPEDFPVQPVVSCGFRLTPSGFFDRNPALDLPEGANRSSCHALGTKS